MNFPFSHVCDLLDDLEKEGLGGPVSVQNWFKKHNGFFRNPRFNGRILLSILLPERRPDRVYGVQEATLSRIFARSQCLGRQSLARLHQWKDVGSKHDLADKIEEYLRDQPQPATEVSIQDIENVLDDLASKYRDSRSRDKPSSPEIASTPEFEASRALPSNSGSKSLTTKAEDKLLALFRSMSSREAKWFTRLVLKKPVALDANSVLACYHHLLPSLLRIQDNIVAALEFLEKESHSRSVIQGPLNTADIVKLKPRLGVKVGRQPFLKGRSIKNCIDMGYGSMSCQQKLDGEYAQIHIDLSRGQGNESIQIFSKSGKDSTADRFRLHSTISESLRLGEGGECKVREGCILEGELVVYSDSERRILDFDEIRKHVLRNGRRLGIAPGDRRKHDEHLMIIYFDLLYLDGESLLHTKLSERLRRLDALIVPRQGHAAVVERKAIDFGARGAASKLRLLFAECIAAGREGLVLKANDPYFDFTSSRRRLSCCPIKIKGGYLKGFGELGDLAVIGARCDAAEAKTYNLKPSPRFTHFYIGCLRNKDAVARWGQTPHFLITNVVQLNRTQLKNFLSHASHGAEPAEGCHIFDIDHHPGVDNGRRPQEIFTNPQVFEIYCFDFHREGAVTFMTPRFPQVKKIHYDRNFKDALTDLELNDLVQEWKLRQTRPEVNDKDLQEAIEKLKRADPGGVAVDAETQRTDSVAVASTPARSSEDADSHGSLSLSLRSPVQTASVQEPLPPRAGSVQAASIPLPEDAKPSRGGRKRLAELAIKSPHKTKKARQSNSQLALRSSSSSPRQVAPATASRGKPLEDITAHSQERDNSDTSFRHPQQLSYERTSTLRKLDPRMDGMTSSQASFHTAPTNTPASPRSTLPSSPPAAGAKPAHKTGPEPPISTDAATGGSSAILPSTSPAVCEHLGTDCVFHGRVFLLSPCVAQMPYLTEDLLASHGARHVYTDITTWRQAQCATRTIVLVEGRRKAKDDTMAFFGEIEAGSRTLGGGAKERVEVLDWRVVEVALRAEEARAGDENQPREPLDRHRVRELWRKHWVGLA